MANIETRRDAIVSAQAELAGAVLLARQAKKALERLRDPALDELTHRALVAIHSLEAVVDELDGRL